MCEKKQKRIVLALDIILIFGLLAYSVILFIINKSLNPLNILGANNEAIQSRLFWRQMAEAIWAVCGASYIVGHMLMLYLSIKKSLHISFQKIFLYLVVQIGIMFVCILPLGLLDLNYFGDYVFPIWGTAGALILIFIIFFLVSLYKKSR